MIISPETVEVESLDDLILLTWYKPKVNKSVPPGFVLADNLLNKKGGILYPKGMELDTDKIERLLKLKENNPDWEFKFSLEKSEKLIKVFKERILVDLDRFIISRKSRQEFRRFMENVEIIVKKYLDEIIPKDDMVIALYKVRFNEETSNPESRTPYYNHLLNTVLMVIGIFQQIISIFDKKFDNDDIIKGAQAGLFQGIGGASSAELFNDKSLEEQRIRYLEGNKSSPAIASNIGLDSNVIDAIKLYIGYYDDKRDFVNKDDKISDYANVGIVASMFNEKISGLFGDSSPIKDVVDGIYVMATKQELKKMFVDALAKSLKLGYLFDFYYEIEKLSKSCPFGKHGRPYPMTGFKSPVIYICRANMTSCRHYISSSKAVTIFRKTGDLEPSSYGRCEWLSDELIEFYDKFYDQIKEDTLTRTRKGSEDK